MFDLFMGESARRRREAGEQRRCIEECRRKDSRQIGRAQPPVPVLYDVTAVHDLPEDVSQVLPGHTHVVVQVVVGTLAAAQQIPRIEGVVHIPSDTCPIITVLSSFRNDETTFE